MKIFPVIIFLLLSCRSQAQKITIKEAEDYARQLVQKDILSIKGKESLLNLIAKTSADSLSKDSILQFCATVFSNEQNNRFTNKKHTEYKITREDSLAGDGWILYPPLSESGPNCIDCLSDKRSTLGFTRTRTLEDFKTMGLISEKVYDDCKKGLYDKSITDEVGLLKYMVSRTIYYRDNRGAPY